MPQDNKKKLEELNAIKHNLLAAVQGVDKQIEAIAATQADDKEARRAMGRAAAKAHSVKVYSGKKKAA